MARRMVFEYLSTVKERAGPEAGSSPSSTEYSALCISAKRYIHTIYPGYFLSINCYLLIRNAYI